MRHLLWIHNWPEIEIIFPKINKNLKSRENYNVKKINYKIIQQLC